MCLSKVLFPVFMFAFIFHCRSFSPEWFSSNEIRLPSTSSVINVIVNIKNNVEKDRTLFVCLFFVLFFFSL